MAAPLLNKKGKNSKNYEAVSRTTFELEGGMLQPDTQQQSVLQKGGSIDFGFCSTHPHTVASFLCERCNVSCCQNCIHHLQAQPCLIQLLACCFCFTGYGVEVRVCSSCAAVLYNSRDCFCYCCMPKLDEISWTRHTRVEMQSKGRYG